MSPLIDVDYLTEYADGEHDDLPPGRLFDPRAGGQYRDPVDPKAVACPTCGAIEGKPCRLRSGRVRPSSPYSPAHTARLAAARWVAGVADEPTPTLFGALRAW